MTAATTTQLAKAVEAERLRVARASAVALTVPTEVGSLSTGRCAVIHCLDCVLAHPENLAKFAQAFQAAVDEDPMALLKSIIMPLTPKDKGGDDGGATVTAESVAAQLCAMSGLVPAEAGDAPAPEEASV